MHTGKYICGVMDSGPEREIYELSSNPSRVWYIHLRTNTIRNGMNLFLPQQWVE